MTTLAEFLLARIAEDEAVARKASPSPWTYGRPGDSNIWGAVSERQGNLIARHIWSQEAAHITRWNPDRVLAECETKRQIVDLHRNNDGGDTGSCGTCTDRDYLGLVDDDWPCPTLRALALPYADHPDYREEWRP